MKCYKRLNQREILFLCIPHEEWYNDYMIDKFINNRILKQQFDTFIHTYSVNLIILFGSYSQGRQRPTSDFDIALRSSEDIRSNKLILINELSEIFGKDVDLVIIDKNTDLMLLNEMVTNGMCLYEKVSDSYIEFKIRIIRMYIDQSFLIKFYQQKLLERKKKELLHVTRSNRS